MSGSFATGSFPVAAQPYSNTCYAFYSDPAFRDRSTPYALYGASGGVCTLSQTGWTFFTTLARIDDPRDPTTRKVSFPEQGAGSLLFDGTLEKSNLNLIESADASLMQAIFSLIDQVGLSTNSLTATTAVLDAQLTADATVGKYYVAGSLKLTKDQQTGNYYDANNKPQTYTTWGDITVTLNVPSGTTTTPIVFHFIMADATWRTDYPYSEIVQVLPSMDWQDLLTGDLSTMTANTLSTVTTLMGQAVSLFSPQMLQWSVTDGLVFNFNAIGPSKAWVESVPFGILYKGQTPSVQQIRDAVQRAMANSGIGTQTDWQNRFPGVFALGRYYLVPMWDMTATLPNRQIYTAFMDAPAMWQKVANIFSNMTTTTLSTEARTFTSPYNLIQLLSFRDPTNDASANIKQITEIHPTYQCVSRDSGMFPLMDASTQTFSSSLIDALSILSGQTPSDSDLYQTVTEMGITSVIFVVDQIEYAVISPTTYNAAQELYQS